MRADSRVAALDALSSTIAEVAGEPDVTAAAVRALSRRSSLRALLRAVRRRYVQLDVTPQTAPTGETDMVAGRHAECTGVLHVPQNIAAGSLTFPTEEI